MRLPVLTALLACSLAAHALEGVPAVLAATSASPRQLQQAKQLRQRGHVPQQGVVWWKALQQAIAGIHRHGAGGYSTADAAHEALAAAFVWNERTKRLAFNEAGARPSFCSGAVYAAALSALIRWDAAQPKPRLSAEAWKSLAPQHVPDGVGAWGCANANGPGFAVLVHRLGAGVSFTEWEKARPSDVAKLWWNDEIGAGERGHLVILVRDEGDSVRVWSSNAARKGEAGGFGFRTFPKSAIRRVLFTRITNPAAFDNAPAIGEDAWLRGLTERNASWEECLRRCGVPAKR